MRPEVTGVPSRLLLPVLVLVSLGVGLAVGEAVARHAYTGPVVIGAMVENDTELGFRLRRGSLARWTTREFDVSIAVDRDVGLRVGDVHDEVPVRPDIAFYGDSFVFGHGVAFEQTFTSVLARRYAGTTILNAGVYNYGPDQEYILAKRLRRRLQPTFEVATFFTGNDFQDFGRYRNLLITPDAVTIKAAADRHGRHPNEEFVAKGTTS